MRRRITRISGAILVLWLAIGPAPGPATAAEEPGTSGEVERALRLEDLDIRGNRHTPDHVIRRHVGLAVGDEVTVDILEAARVRLAATDYFTRVDVYARRGTERGAVVVVIDVEEHGYPVFETGFGYHDLNGWFLTLLGLRFDHLLGDDSQTRVGLRVGFRLSGLDAEWCRLLSDDGRFGVGVKLHLYDFEHRFFGAGPGATDENGRPTPWGGAAWEGYQQSIGRGGGEVALLYSPDRHTRFRFGVSAERVKPDSTFEASEGDDEFDVDLFPDPLQSGLDHTTITRFFLHAIRDTRNNPAYPTAGSFARMTLDINNSLLGGDQIFTRAEADFRQHWRVTGGWVLSSHASAGMVTDGAPYYERYYLGGIYSLRGFQEWSLSATDGDDGFWMVSEELRWPLAGRPGEPPRLTGLVFVDVGQGWRRSEPFTASDVESAAGYGLRLRMPWLGTFGFDIGIPISEGRTGDPVRAHASLGFSF